MAMNNVARVLLSVVVMAVLGGCGSSLDDSERTPSPEQIAHAEDMMRKLPSVQDTEAQLIALIRQIAEAVRSVAPGLAWETEVNRGQNTLGCPGPYLKTDGVSMTTDRLISSVPISDTEWPNVLRMARSIAAEQGITSVTIIADQPGRHDVTLHSPDHGNEIRLGTRKAALITGVTGCRFRAEDLRNPPAK
ncbi:LppA family lipoprotein [Nocardia cyriacigeorgica]|uniref:LppA family lipoprotein n=1 Tax=Nocardia cyriacigeorgica TaxID=135487 RepID=UPI0013D7F569|nr:LppA family lipoprotein [Nocardia cyriacigeorgica]NEW29982.1 hypothetical protein [Nocardia cyriacigeorgica]